MSRITELQRELANFEGTDEERTILGLQLEVEQWKERHVSRGGVLHVFQSLGKILVLESGIIAVPYSIEKGGAYAVVVGHTKDANERTKFSYGVGGHNLWLGNEDILRARYAHFLEELA